MKISILGNGLTSLTLAKMLANQNVKVDVYSDKNTKKNNKIQTLGISKTNIEFFNDKILNIEKYVWDIKKIEIHTENLTKEKVLNVNNQHILTKLPVTLSELIEKLNINFLKLQYKDQSNYKISKYSLDINSKNFFTKDKSLRLTEKEIATILYLSKFNKPISIKELQLKVWDHKSLLETHTVETHIHRLRKKIKEKFNDDNFIKSLKEGYYIN